MLPHSWAFFLQKINFSLKTLAKRNTVNPPKFFHSLEAVWIIIQKKHEELKTQTTNTNKTSCFERELLSVSDVFLHATRVFRCAAHPHTQKYFQRERKNVNIAFSHSLASQVSWWDLSLVDWIFTLKSLRIDIFAAELLFDKLPLPNRNKLFTNVLSYLIKCDSEWLRHRIPHLNLQQ